MQACQHVETSLQVKLHHTNSLSKSLTSSLSLALSLSLLLSPSLYLSLSRYSRLLRVDEPEYKQKGGLWQSQPRPMTPQSETSCRPRAERDRPHSHCTATLHRPETLKPKAQP